jgi:phosphoribosylglycinamide formyltransferase 2
MQRQSQPAPYSHLGTPLGTNANRVLLLGSGELGKELVIAFQRLGVEVCACDRYPDAPAMQVAHRSRVFDMTDSKRLRQAVLEEHPAFIVPEVEAINTATLADLEAEGHRVIPTAKATLLTMDREGIRRFAAEELDLPTARYCFAESEDQLRSAATSLGFPCVVKPLMSSSGKGQSVIQSPDQITAAWKTATTEGRVKASAKQRVIVEEFVPFESEITLLTVRSAGGTVFCPPIGHVQSDGDYVESWQPHPMADAALSLCRTIATRVTEALGGYGLFGVELFLLKDGRVLFNEVSPRPHDTGMVTLVSQDLSEFDLHARAILGLPVHIPLLRAASASAALRAEHDLRSPAYHGLAQALSDPRVSVRLFGKPSAKPRRRMGVILAMAEDVETARKAATDARDMITIHDELS